MMKPRISLLIEHEREDRRSKLGDPLGGLTRRVDFEGLAASIDVAAPRPSRAEGGRPPYSTLLMVKIPAAHAARGLPAPGQHHRHRWHFRAFAIMARHN